jgi:riboflavin biosynthesis pyrimidine reductase
MDPLLIGFASQISNERAAAIRGSAQARQRLVLDRAHDVAVVIGELLVREDIPRGEERDAVDVPRILHEDRLDEQVWVAAVVDETGDRACAGGG